MWGRVYHINTSNMPRCGKRDDNQRSIGKGPDHLQDQIGHEWTFGVSNDYVGFEVPPAVDEKGHG